MRIPKAFGWALLLASLFTAGLLRQFHAFTPVSPFAPPAVGSLLFASVVFLFLVSAREQRFGAAPGPGIRMGTLTPVLLMLLVEKWVSISLYNPAFYVLAPEDAPEALLDAWYRAFAGAGLLAVCLLVANFSKPAKIRTWARIAPRLAPRGLATAVIAALGACGILWLFAVPLRIAMRPSFPEPGVYNAWIVVGQATLAFAEELYYRGLLLQEIGRIAPRLGAVSPIARRWVPLLLTSALFGMEHVTLAPSEAMGEVVFSAALGALLGLLVLLTDNLWISVGLHAWINWLVLGVAPHWADARGRMIPAPGAYVSLALVVVFVAAYFGRFARSVNRRAA